MKYTLRIKKNKAFKYIFKKGSYSKGKYVIVHSCKTKYDIQENSYNFFGVCVSKKNGNSVARNRLKRLAREVYKNEENKLIKGINVVVVYKKETNNTINFSDIKLDITNCFKELGLYE